MKLGNVIVFGDSYSTYKDCIPEGYAHYYGREDTQVCGVLSADMTWWHMLVKECEGNLLLNDSWSGSTVCYTGYEGDCSKTNSFIYRLEGLIDNGFFADNSVDTVLVFGGTNDNWANAPEGEATVGEVEFNERFKVIPAFCHFATLLRSKLPEARIIFIINTELKETVTSGIAKASEINGCDSLLLSDIDKCWGHPTALGMVQIKDQIKAVL